ncbi:hypothetical protein Q1695_005226 [Nippostrongylus brasiliensis]|nr:hypothetical protein Q1695_005226 [Nippostrongylus brasiliensis]
MSCSTSHTSVSASTSTSSSRSTAGQSNSDSSSGRSSRSKESSHRLTGDFLEITVTSLMEGVGGARILVPPLCTVGELKSIVSDATDVQAEKQVLIYDDVELRDDSASIARYGIKKDCNLTLNVKMNTGSKVARSHASMNALFMPLVMGHGALPQLRNSIKTLTTIHSRPVYRGGKIDPSKEYTTNWTPAKQMEHELTRSRMKRLRRTRSRNRILSDSSTRTRSPKQGSDSRSSESSLSQSSKSGPSYESSMTEKELKNFFSPHESVEELRIDEENMTVPPTNVKDLFKLKTERRKASRTHCNFCYRKLALTEQEITCLCDMKFCKKHRLPATHHCSIDYKQTGRNRIERDNPKVQEGGNHKAREE